MRTKLDANYNKKVSKFYGKWQCVGVRRKFCSYSNTRRISVLQMSGETGHPKHLAWIKGLGESRVSTSEKRDAKPRQAAVAA